MRLLATLLCAALVGGGTPAVAAAAADEARELLDALGCKGCHQLNGDGGTLGPALDGVGARLSREQLRRRLIAPREANPETLMPAYDELEERQLGLLLDYLQSLQ